MDGEPEFDRSWLMLCEGRTDKEFFHRLIKVHQVCVGKFKIYFPGDRHRDAGGNGEFGRYLSAMRVIKPSFRDNVEAVLIVSDNDDDMEASLERIRANLDINGFPAPDRTSVVAKKRNYPDVVILMLPFDAVGNLETLWLDAAYSKWEIRPALDDYVKVVPAVAWSVGKQSKMRMHSILAATCATKPETSFLHHWQEHEDYHIPLNDPCFNDLVDFLRNFEALLNGA